MWVELFGRREDRFDAIRSKIPIILSEPAPGNQMPSVCIIGQSRGLDFPAQRVSCTGTAISNPQHGAIRECLLNKEKAARTISLRRIWQGHSSLEPGDVILLIRRQDR